MMIVVVATTVTMMSEEAQAGGDSLLWIPKKEEKFHAGEAKLLTVEEDVTGMTTAVADAAAEGMTMMMTVADHAEAAAVADLRQWTRKSKEKFHAGEAKLRTVEEDVTGMKTSVAVPAVADVPAVMMMMTIAVVDHAEAAAVADLQQWTRKSSVK